MVSNSPLQSSTGYEARLTRAFVDMGKGTVTSDEHVDVKLLNGTLTADKLRIFNSGEIVRFEGNVVMNLDKLTDEAAPGQPGDATAASSDPAPSGKTRPGPGKSPNPK